MSASVDQGTLALVDRVLDGDKAVTQRMRLAIHHVLKGEDVPAQPPEIVAPLNLDRVLSRNEAARILNVTPRVVTTLAKRGTIATVTLTGTGKRAAGYTLRSVQECIRRSSSTVKTEDAA